MSSFHLRILQRDLRDSLIVIKDYNWLIDAYMLDFYTEDHWTRLPSSWRRVFNKFEDVHLLADLLLQKSEASKSQATIVLPLSLLALRENMRRLCASRIVPENHLGAEDRQQKSPFKHLFRQVKEKKRHEIERMAELCAQSAHKCGVKYIVDFGAGLGHLARILSFQHGLRVCCLEQQEKLTEEAKFLDNRAKEIHTRQDQKPIATPVHLNFKLTAETVFQDLFEKIKDAFGVHPEDSSFSLGIVGLHPCGDLAIILTKFFLECKYVRFLNIVGCCYMKLTTEISNASPRCHPVSKFLQTIYPEGLSYEAREIACHAIETYEDRLRSNNYDYLKIHCYRALMERILCRHYPEMRHCGLKSVKQKDGLTFVDYSRIVLDNLQHIKIPENEIVNEQIDKELAEWKKVVIFYTLRLFFAPLNETVLLYDRMLWILETDDRISCDLRVTFDPMKSPRNHVMIAEKCHQ